jgi:hypothetical protein
MNHPTTHWVYSTEAGGYVRVKVRGTHSFYEIPVQFWALLLLALGGGLLVF